MKINPKDIKAQPVQISKIAPYANNARINDDAVPGVKASIEQFGFVNPILCEKDGTIIAGHTRLRAAQELGMKTVPVIYLPHLTKKQAAALRLADNKLSEMSSWDFEKLDKELDAIAKMDGDDLDLGELGFPTLGDDPFGGDDTAPAGGDGAPAVPTATATDGGAAAPGVAGNLPPELAGQALMSTEQEKLDIEAPTNMERVIIVYPKARAGEVAALIGLERIDKVVYTIDEVLPTGGKE